MNISEFINNISSNLDSITKNLDIFVKEGIPIIDTYAPITTWVNIGTTLITTLIGTGIGTGFTMWLFKRQEKLRIRQDLRLDFYKLYKNKYNELYEDINLLFNEIVLIKSVPKREEYLKIKPPIMNFDTNCKVWNISYPEHVLKNSIKQSEKIAFKLDSFNKYINSNNVIHRKDNIDYISITKNINKITTTFVIISTAFNIINTEDELGMVESFKESEFRNYNMVISDILKFDELLKTIILDMEKIHSRIENQFLGQYFK